MASISSRTCRCIEESLSPGSCTENVHQRWAQTSPHRPIEHTAKLACRASSQRCTIAPQNRLCAVSSSPIREQSESSSRSSRSPDSSSTSSGS
eukprot:scaffold5981_cov141-Isochrysis_galbana.AAC.9